LGLYAGAESGDLHAFGSGQFIFVKGLRSAMVQMLDNPSECDFDEIASFQRRVFGYQLLNAERWRIQTANYYRWKYAAPLGPARLAIIRRHGALTAMAAAVPFLIECSEGKRPAWQICDIATEAGSRNKGYFRACLQALRAAAGGEWMFCFPNRKSRHGMHSAGLRAQTTVQLVARPINPWSRSTNSSLRGAGKPVDAEDSPELIKSEIKLVKSAEFLAWRYSRHPCNHYDIIATQLGDTEGFVVTRAFSIIGLRLALVMEAHPPSEAGLRAGFVASERWARTNRCHALVATRPVGPGTRLLNGISLPRTLQFFASGPDGTADDRGGRSWRIELGDWDAL
jgi:hypothetical protein